MATTAAVKSELRASIRADRTAMSEDRRAATRQNLTARLIDLVLSREAKTITCFLPTRTEPDTRGFLDWAEAHGIDVLLPSSRADGLLDWIRPTGEGTVRGAHGIAEPVGESLGPRALDAVDLMLIPAAAVDVHGNRLGWGLGYFDRALATLSQQVDVFAVVYDHEVLESVPVEPHDEPLTGAVTQKRTLIF